MSGCATSTVTNPVTGLQERTVMSVASEIAEGKKGHAQVLQEYRAFLQMCSQALARGSPSRLS